MINEARAAHAMSPNTITVASAPRFTPLIPTHTPGPENLCAHCGFRRDAHVKDLLGGPALCPEKGITGEWGENPAP